VAGNPFDVAAPSKPAAQLNALGPQPDFVAALKPLAKGIRTAGGTALGKVLDLLDRPAAAVQANLAGHPEQSNAAFIHGRSPAQRDENMAAMRHRAHLDEIYRRSPHIGQGAIDMLLGTATDPTTLAGSGALENLGRHIAPHVLPAILKGAGKFTEGAVKQADRFGHGIGTREWLDNRGHQAAALFDALGPGNQLKRELAQRFGAKGDAMFAAAYQARNASKQSRQQITNALVGEYRKAIHGLSETDEAAVYDAVHTGTEHKLSPELQARAQQISHVYDTAAHLEGTRGLQKQLEAHGFKLPDWAQALHQRDAAGRIIPRAIQKTSEYRKNYLPLAHEAEAWNDPEIVQRIANRKEKYASGKDVHMKARAGEDAGLLDPGMQREINEARLSHAARAIAGKDTARRVAAEVLPRTAVMREVATAGPKDDPLAAFEAAKTSLSPEQLQRMQRSLNLPNIPKPSNPETAAALERVQNAFKPASTVQKAAGSRAGRFADVPGAIKSYLNPKVKAGSKGDAFIRSAVDLPKQALFALPFRHGLNIATLAALHDPGALLEAIPEFAKQYKRGKFLLPEYKSEAERAAQDTIHGGVANVPSLDRDTTWLQKKMPWMKEGTKPIPGVSNLYGASSHALWGFDDAVKAATYRRALRHGLSPAQAHRETMNALLDYGDRSALTDVISHIAPFGTYRSKMPGAVLRATAKHPERVQAINRLSPSWAGGEQPSDQVDDKGNPQVVRTGNPLSDTFEGIDDRGAFLRSTLSYPWQMLLSAGSVHDSKDPNHIMSWLAGQPGYDNYMTYGKKVGLNKESLKYTLNQIPYIQSALDALGLGIFPDKGLRGFIEGQTGVRLSKSKQKAASSSGNPFDAVGH